jgi:beta-lactamase class A
MRRTAFVAAGLLLVGAAGCGVGEVPRGPAAGTAAIDLATQVRAALDALDARTSLYARHLPTGREIAIRADEPMNTLSVIKVPAMVLAYRDAEAGRLDLDARHRIRADELRRGSGLLQTFAVGLEPTYKDLVTQMIITSDNTATDIIVARLGLDRINAFLQEAGFPETAFRLTTGDLFREVWVRADPAHAALTDREVFERGFPTDAGAAARSFALEGDSTRWLGRSTARGTARLLEAIHNGSLASRGHSDTMVAILSRQFYSSRLPRYIQFDARVAHKTGDWPPIAGNDVGILYYDGGPTVVAAYTNQNRGDFVELERTLGRIARDIVAAWR